MKTYKVINTFAERDKEGKTTGKYIDKGQEVELESKEAERLSNANCVIETETRVVTPPSNRGNSGNKKNSKRVNSRASKPK